MSLPKYFISCDWGTTNFRLKLVNTSSLETIAETKSDQGVKVHFEQFLSSQSTDREIHFASYIKAQLKNFPGEYQNELIIASGMMSSTIGIKSLPYVDMPISMDGKDLYWEKLSLSNGLNVLLISGIKTSSCMMRGEEVQAIGLQEELAKAPSGLLILPGTHSKHISFKNGEYTGLENFMTGELFDMLITKSILSNSVAVSDWDENKKSMFLEGFSLGCNKRLTANLLSVRVNDVINHKNKEENYYYLSGLLLGDELSYLKGTSTKIFLAAPASTARLYEIALKYLLNSDQIELLDPKGLDMALLKGQKKILLNLSGL